MFVSTDNMRSQIKADKTGYLWLHWVMVNLQALWNHPFDSHKRESEVIANYGLSTRDRSKD